jgi:uncharacterized protein (TIGR03437 family)
MFRVWMALAVVAFCGVARGQAPLYSAASIVNASDYSQGPFAPNSVLTIFGSNLANIPVTSAGVGLTQQNINSGTLPLELASISVYIDSSQVPLLYASSTQINFLVPTSQVAGDVQVWVVRQSFTGPKVTITLANTAPALFPSTDHFAAAQDFEANYAAVTAAAPAQPGDLIVLYATGLGATQPLPETGEIPKTAGLIVPAAFASLQVLLNGNAIDPRTMFYAGMTPGFAGLYQVNFFLPGNCPPNPQIQLAIGQQISAAGIMLAVQ